MKIQRHHPRLRHRKSEPHLPRRRVQLFGWDHPVAVASQRVVELRGHKGRGCGIDADWRGVDEDHAHGGDPRSVRLAGVGVGGWGGRRCSVFGVFRRAGVGVKRWTGVPGVGSRLRKAKRSYENRR